MNKPTHDIELEQTLLGYVIENPSSFDLVRPIIANLDYFYWNNHKSIYLTLLDLDAKQEQWDELIIGNLLKKQNKLKAIGGYEYLVELTLKAPSNCNIAYYAYLLRENYTENKVIVLCDELKTKISAGGKNPVYSISEAVGGTIIELSRLQATLGARKSKVRAINEIMPIVYKEMEEAADGKVIPALNSGMGNLDDMLGGGLYRSEFNILAARPSIGKTSMAVNIANHCSPGTKILFISLETTGESILRDRLFPLELGIYSTKLRNPKTLDGEDWDNLGRAGNIFNEYKYFKVCDQARMTIEDIELLVAAEIKEEGGGLDFLIIDYLQLIGTTQKFKSRERQIAEISIRLKALIKEHSLFSLILAQLNRESEKSKRKPILSDLRESGQLEQDADTIIFLHEDKEDRDKPLLAIAAKNRNGPPGEAEFYFNKKRARFESVSESQNF